MATDTDQLDAVDSDIGPRLKSILRSRGWTLRRLSKESGVSPSGLSLIVRHHRGTLPTVRTVQRICGALQLPPSALIRPAGAGRPGGVHAVHDGLPTVEGAAIVQVMRFDVGDEPSDTGQTTLVSASVADGHVQLQAVVIDGSGFGPYVLAGDTITYDTVEQPLHGTLVVLSYQQRATAAVHLLKDGESCYQLADGSLLTRDDVNLVGVVVQIARRPPPPRTLLLTVRL